MLERRVFVELPDEEKERLARESGLDLEFVGLLRKCMYGAVDASARRQGHHAQTTCGSDQLEQSGLSHKHCPQCWRYSVMQTMLETWERANPLWNGGHVGITFDQAWERGARHHSTEQWRV